jgi:hypothetical protein
VDADASVETSDDADSNNHDNHGDNGGDDDDDGDDDDGGGNGKAALGGIWMHRSRRGHVQDQTQKTSRKGHRLWLLPRIFSPFETLNMPSEPSSVIPPGLSSGNNARSQHGDENPNAKHGRNITLNAIIRYSAFLPTRADGKKDDETGGKGS